MASCFAAGFWLVLLIADDHASCPFNHIGTHSLEVVGVVLPSREEYLCTCTSFLECIYVDGERLLL